MELSAFSAINRFQPFNVAVSSNVLLLMVSHSRVPGGGAGGHRRPVTTTSRSLCLCHRQDFHCHLTTSEVVGYLGGRWDTNTQCEYGTVFCSRWKFKKKNNKTLCFPLCAVCSVLTVLRAFPCRTRLADRDAASAVEEEVTESLL